MVHWPNERLVSLAEGDQKCTALILVDPSDSASHKARICRIPAKWTIDGGASCPSHINILLTEELG